MIPVAMRIWNPTRLAPIAGTVTRMPSVVAWLRLRWLVQGWESRHHVCNIWTVDDLDVTDHPVDDIKVHHPDFYHQRNGVMFSFVTPRTWSPRTGEER